MNIVEVWKTIALLVNVKLMGSMWQKDRRVGNGEREKEREAGNMRVTR